MAKIINYVNTEPDSDNSRDIGSSVKRFANIFGANGEFNGSLKIPVFDSHPSLTAVQKDRGGNVYFNRLEKVLYIFDGEGWVGISGNVS